MEQKTGPFNGAGRTGAGDAPEEIRRYFRVRLEDLAYLRFLLEAYDGLAVLTSLPGRAEVEWVIPADRAAEADALASALGREITLVPIPRPADWPRELAPQPRQPGP